MKEEGRFRVGNTEKKKKNNLLVRKITENMGKNLFSY